MRDGSEHAGEEPPEMRERRRAGEASVAVRETRARRSERRRRGGAMRIVFGVLGDTEYTARNGSSSFRRQNPTRRGT